MERIITDLEETVINILKEKIKKSMEEFLEDPSRLSEFVIHIRENTDELARKMIESTLMLLDEQFRQSPERKAVMHIRKNDRRKLVTSLGEICFSHTMFCDKDGNNPRYLLDEAIGLDPEERMTEDAVAALLTEAAESSYAKAGRTASRDELLSRQTVKNKIHDLRFPPIRYPELKRRVTTLYIEADEDHASLQFNSRKGDLEKDENGRKTNCAITKIVYVHEGLEKESPNNRRRRLIHPHYFGGIYAGADNRKLWEEVYQYICGRYEISSIRHIILGADGGSWIKTAQDVIPRLTYALDEFHLSKYLLKISAFLGDSAADVQAELKEAIRCDKQNKFDQDISFIMDQCTTESGRKRIRESADFIRNNWEAAGRRLLRAEGIVGCSAEGHVSHILSSRMSSRPMGWSKIGADKMTRLRIYAANGGDMLELAKYQRTAVNEELPKAAGGEGLSCTAVLRSEKNPHPMIGKYAESFAAAVSESIRGTQWFKAIQNSGLI